MLFNIILGSIMAVSFIALIVCGKKQHDNSAAKPLAFLFVLMIVICGVVMLIHYKRSTDPERYIKENRIFQESSAYVLADFLGKDLSACQVVVFLDENKNDDPGQKALKKGLEKGFNGSIHDIIYLTPKGTSVPVNRESNAKIMDSVKAQDINIILSKYPKCKVLITLIGLPKDLNNLNLVKEFIETKKTPMKIGFLNSGFEEYQALIKANFISAATASDPTKKYNLQSPSSDLKETFDMRFFLLTSKNVDQIAKQFPRKIFRETTSVKKK